MSKVIIYEQQNGKVAITVPSSEYLNLHSIEDLMSTMSTTISSCIMLEEEFLPQDSIWFDAWELKNGSIIINLEKAKEITKSRLRRERSSLLSNLDVQFYKLLESGADTSEVVKQKQYLRDITLSTDNCSTIEELKNLTCYQTVQ